MSGQKQADLCVPGDLGRVGEPANSAGRSRVMETKALIVLMMSGVAGTILAGVTVNALIAKRINQLHPDAYRADRPSVFDKEGQKILKRKLAELRRSGTGDQRLNLLLRVERVLSVVVRALFLTTFAVGFGYQQGYLPHQLG